MKKIKELLKTELSIVHLTTNNKKFLNINDAIEYQGILNKHKDKKVEEIQVMIDIKNLVKKVLEENDWGIYFKAEPITSLPVQDNSKIYKVNDINIDRLMDSLDDKLSIESREDEWRDNQQATNLNEKP